MKKVFFLFGLAMIIALGGCKKEKATGGDETLSCEITSPEDGAELSITEDIIVTVETKSSNEILAVTVHLDDLPCAAVTAEPYTLVIFSELLTIGHHTIKAKVVDNSAAQAESSITVNIIKSDYDSIPYVFIDTTIDVSSAMYHNLEFIGGWGYIPSGYKGIFLYHVTENQFIALERCCTYDPEIFEARVDYDEKSGLLRDAVCGSEFHPFLNGNVTKGPAELPLRQYKTQYYESGALKRLRIYN